jgi:hypothetical protein
MPQHQDHHRDQRARLAAAAVTGLLAGAARAFIDWLLHHSTSI